MSPITGKDPIAKITGFKGLFSRGNYDTCPPDHLTDCFNCIFSSNQIGVREPVTVQTGPILGRTFLSYFIATVSTGARLLTLSVGGNFRDETTATFLGTFAGADDFTAINIFGRTYICFKAMGKAMTGFNGALFYYDGLVVRPAAGLGPASSPILAQANPGVVDIGNHNVAVVFQSLTGYLTKITFFSSITSPGNKDIELSGIPLGGPDMVARVILMTKSNGTEFFFVPGGTINNNVATTAIINVHDSALIASADYLNNLTTALVPGGTALRFYRGRLVIIGNALTPDIVYVSRVSDPETFDLIFGLVRFPADYGLNTCNTGLIIRDVLYIMKPNGTYATQDNGGDPSTWSVTLVDSGLGGWDSGLTLFASSFSGSDVSDTSFVINRRGLLIFNGTYSQIPLTYKIQSLWDLINNDLFSKCQIAHDVWKRRVYIGVPIDPPLTGDPFVSGGSNLKTILMMDYQDGLDPTTVKWSTWTSGAFGAGITKMSVENFTLVYPPPFGTVPIYQLSFCNGDSVIYKIILPQGILGQTVPIATIPDNAASNIYSINQYIITPPVKKGDGMYCWIMINLLVEGFGNLRLSAYTKNKSQITNLRSFALQTYNPRGMELQRYINLMSESFQLLIQADQTIPLGLNGFFQVNEVDLYANKMWSMRPSLSESA